MGRPGIGRAAKSAIASVRLTEEEKAELTSVFGSPAKGLRALLNAWRANRKDPR